MDLISERQFLRVPSRFNFSPSPDLSAISSPHRQTQPYSLDYYQMIDKELGYEEDLTHSLYGRVKKITTDPKSGTAGPTTFEGRRQNSKFSSFKSLGPDPTRRLNLGQTQRCNITPSLLSPPLSFDCDRYARNNMGPSSMVGGAKERENGLDDLLKPISKYQYQPFWGSFNPDTYESMIPSSMVKSELDRYGGNHLSAQGRWITDSGYSSNLSPDGPGLGPRVRKMFLGSRNSSVEDFDTLTIHRDDVQPRNRRIDGAKATGQEANNRSFLLSSTNISSVGSNILTRLTPSRKASNVAQGRTKARATCRVSKSDMERIDLFYRGFKTRVMHVASCPVDFYVSKEQACAVEAPVPAKKGDEGREKLKDGSTKWVYKFTGIPLLIVSAGQALPSKSPKSRLADKEASRSQVSPPGKQSIKLAREANERNDDTRTNMLTNTEGERTCINASRLNRSESSCSSEEVRSIGSKLGSGGQRKQIIPSQLWTETINSCLKVSAKGHSPESSKSSSFSLVIAEMGTGFLLWKADILKVANPLTGGYISGIDRYEEVKGSSPSDNFHVVTRKQGALEDKNTAQVGLRFKEGSGSQEFLVALERCLTSIRDDGRENSAGSKHTKEASPLTRKCGKNGLYYSENGLVIGKKIPKIPLKSTISAPCQFQHVTQLSLRDADKFYTLSHLVDGDRRLR